MQPIVIDLSHHNTIPSSLKQARSFGVEGVIHKITEGIGFIDSKAQARFHLAREAGLLWGGYHYLKKTALGDVQAKYFVQTMERLGILDDKTLLAADHEERGTPLSTLMEFLGEVEKLTDRRPVIYSGFLIKEQLTSYAGSPWAGDYRLWLAQYSNTPTLPKGFSNWWLWQYTDKGKVPGIDGNVDLNAYSGDIDQLATEWAGHLKGTSPPPNEVKPPVESPVSVTIKAYAPPGVDLHFEIVRT